jgi:hypothetical protein
VSAPYEIVAAPYTAWLAPAGTASPKLTEAESEFKTPWKKVGTSGDLDYSEAGVTVTHSQTIATFLGAGSTVPRKAWRTDESLEVAFELADVSPTQYALVLDNRSITVVAGVTGTGEKIGEEKFSLYKGIQVYAYALLLRGPSSVEENLPAQYYVPACYQAANPAPKYSLKGGPAMLALQFAQLMQTPGVAPELVIGTPA